MHVNLSVKQMNEDGLVQLVADVLAETKLAARKLVLEVTESIFILHYERHVKILNTLRAKGIGVALDDFGCGYSSLNHLRHLPIDWVKIDRSFISALESDAGSRRSCRRCSACARPCTCRWWPRAWRPKASARS